VGTNDEMKLKSAVKDQLHFLLETDWGMVSQGATLRVEDLGSSDSAAEAV
jgi:hypothetical protein